MTGTPFVDLGIVTLCGLSGKENPTDLTVSDLQGAVDMLSGVYTSDAWYKALCSIFPNNAITNPNIKQPDKEKRYRDYLYSLINDIGGGGDRTCVSCGKYYVTSLRLRMEIPMLGSGKFINFFPNGQEGADYCPACTLAVQFFPISTRKGADLFALHSHSFKILRSWVKDGITKVREESIFNAFSGPLKPNSNNPRNALFEFTQDILTDLQEDDELERPSVDLIQFSNFQQSSKLMIYHLPTKIFEFLFDVRHSPFRYDWDKIVRRGYQVVKKTGDVDLNKTNVIYERILDEKSIVHFFIKSDERAPVCEWDLVELYLECVLDMDKKRVEIIKTVADNMGNFIVENHYLKNLYRLENSKTYDEFRNQLRKIQREWVKSKREGVPFSFDDYVNYLFPESALGWRDTRDLMLFRIYEIMSSSGIKTSLDSIPEEDTEFQEKEE